jgi:hypothetical protein
MYCERGIPAVLPLEGPVSLRSLITALKLDGKPADYADALSKYGSVRKTRSGGLKLSKRYLYGRNSGVAPYEAFSEFLHHATVAGTMSLMCSPNDIHGSFTSATEYNLTKIQIAKFVSAVRERSRTVISEFDDLLESAATRNSAKTQTKVRNSVGVTIFTFVTAPDKP